MENILVRPVETRGRKPVYEIVDGLRRWTAATNLKLPSLRAEIREMTDEEVVQYCLMHKVLSEDLNPADRTDAALQLLADRLQCDTEAVVALLNRAAHERKRGLSEEDADSVIRTAEWLEVESFFKTVGVTPESFRANWLPILRFPPDLLDYIRQGKIEYTKARLLARVKDAGLRQQVLGEAIAQDLSHRQIRDRLAEIIELKSGRSPEDAAFIQRFNEASRSIPAVLRDKKKRAKVENLLKQLEALLSS